MPPESLERLLTRLDELKHQFGPDDLARKKKLLEAVATARLTDPESLIRFHEILLFMRAYPQSVGLLRLSERLLSGFAGHVDRLRRAGSDLSEFDPYEASGIAGSEIVGVFSYGIASWLARRYPARVSIGWDSYEKVEGLGATLPRWLPLLKEDALVEANIPYSAWLRAAIGPRGRDLPWLIDRLEHLALSERERAELYDSLNVPTLWKLGSSPASRTKAGRRPRKTFYHQGPLIPRRDVSVADALTSLPLPVNPLSHSEGQSILDMAREAVTVRYRELYGITYGDSSRVMRADAGRGVEVFLWGLARERRLPLRAYHAGVTLKNGVPVNYIEAISLFERAEVGFNMFYTFRDGESAWTYARILRLLNQVLGVTCFAVDPYQIGFGNDEAIESGAFWFYRKLGFRPTRAELARLAESEEKKIRSHQGYRSSPRILRRLAKGPVIYEAPGSRAGDWDRFHIRNIGLAVQRRMASRFGGDAATIRATSMAAVARAVGLGPSDLGKVERQAFEQLSLALALIPDLARWSESEKDGVVAVVRAKLAPDEARYLRLLQRHGRLRGAIIKIGSSRVPVPAEG